jgi:nickel-dependent lactate racemase
LRIEVAYGSSLLPAEIPKENMIGILEPETLPITNDEGHIISEALRSQATVLAPKKSASKVAIVVDDRTRETPTRKILLPLLKKLEHEGVQSSRITIIFACGVHRAVKPEEAQKLLGTDITEKYDAISHDSRSRDLIDVGVTKTFGNKVAINKQYFDADCRILTGDVELHYYAGYGGGRKSVLPGISSESSVQRNHSMLFHPNARIGNLEGNPVHIDMTEGARLAPPNLTINIVKDSRGRIIGTFAGDMDEVLHSGSKLVDRLYKVPIQRKADMVVVGAGGYDIDFYQAYKAIHTALCALKDGGKLIVAAECRDGHGSELFYDWIQRYSDKNEIKRVLEENFILGGHKAYLILDALSRASISVVTKMPEPLVKKMRVEYAPSLQEAIDDGVKANPKASIYVITKGGSTLPVLST